MLVGPVPPPHGGMANQTRQLAELLRREGATVELVAVNAPYRPAWAGRVPGLRAGFRLLPYVARLWAAAGRADVAHVMASSGWSWHLYAAPAVWVANARRVPAVVNYRGGGAGEFFRSAIGWVRPTLRRCAAIVVPSAFLERVFGEFGFTVQVVPNVVDLGRFAPGAHPRPSVAPRLVVARNLEPVYDVGTALRALRIVRERIPGARMAVAGSGPALASLEAEAAELGIRDAVEFTGRLENERMAAFYREADLVLNPSLVDNMPISILEAFASGIPVVTTNVGGIPDLVGVSGTAVLVPPRDPDAMARAAVDLLSKPERAEAQIRAALDHVRSFAWSEIRPRLLAVYTKATRRDK